MRRRAFNVLLLLSLVALAILAMGFVGSIGILVTENSPMGATPAYRENSYEFRDGRFEIWRETWRSAPLATTPSGRSYRWVSRLFPPRVASLNHAIAGFDNHALPGVRRGSLGGFLTTCPLWCIALPFLIAPSLWLRKRITQRKQQRQDIRGFTIRPT